MGFFIIIKIIIIIKKNIINYYLLLIKIIIIIKNKKSQPQNPENNPLLSQFKIIQLKYLEIGNVGCLRRRSARYFFV